MRLVLRLGDPGSHGGVTVTSGQSGKATAEGIEMCVNGAIYSCPIHGEQVVVGNLSPDIFIEDKELALDGSTASCGAIMIATAIKTFGN